MWKPIKFYGVPEQLVSRSTSVQTIIGLGQNKESLPTSAQRSKTIKRFPGRTYSFWPNDYIGLDKDNLSPVATSKGKLQIPCISCKGKAKTYECFASGPGCCVFWRKELGEPQYQIAGVQGQLLGPFDPPTILQCSCSL